MTEQLTHSAHQQLALLVTQRRRVAERAYHCGGVRPLLLTQQLVDCQLLQLLRRHQLAVDEHAFHRLLLEADEEVQQAGNQLQHLGVVAVRQ